MNETSPKSREYVLLGVLALLWGSSYLFIKIAIEEIPPLTLVAVRVLIGASLLWVVMRVSSHELPENLQTWRQLFVQAFLNSVGAWTVLAWGQQFVEAGLAGVLNSTAPIFVFLITLAVTRNESTHLLRFIGVLTGLAGVVMLFGIELVDGMGDRVFGQLACLSGAIMYAMAAIYGKRFNHLGALVTATGTLICASVVMLPLALLIEQPWTLRPSIESAVATLLLSVFCTAIAFLLYFRLVRTLGAMGVASQAYLRSAIAVLLGIAILGENLELNVVIGVVAAIAGVAMINWAKPVNK